jgi:hypothetical protein
MFFLSLIKPLRFKKYKLPRKEKYTGFYLATLALQQRADFQSMRYPSRELRPCGQAALDRSGRSCCILWLF